MPTRLRTCLRVADDWTPRAPKTFFEEALQKLLARCVGIDEDEHAGEPRSSTDAKWMSLEEFVSLHWENDADKRALHFTDMPQSVPVRCFKATGTISFHLLRRKDSVNAECTRNLLACVLCSCFRSKLSKTASDEDIQVLITTNKLRIASKHPQSSQRNELAVLQVDNHSRNNVPNGQMLRTSQLSTGIFDVVAATLLFLCQKRISRDMVWQLLSKPGANLSKSGAEEEAEQQRYNSIKKKLEHMNRKLNPTSFTSLAQPVHRSPQKDSTQALVVPRPMHNAPAPSERMPLTKTRRTSPECRCVAISWQGVVATPEVDRHDGGTGPPTQKVCWDPSEVFDN